LALASRESPRAIRKKATFGERSNAHEGVCNENFFVAKIYDSESASGSHRASLRAAPRIELLSSHHAVVQEMACSAGFSCDRY
jgi:hypothetical protein